MKDLDSIETKKGAQCQIVSKWQSWDSYWGTHSLKSDFLFWLNLEQEKPWKGTMVLNHWNNVADVLN